MLSSRNINPRRSRHPAIRVHLNSKNFVFFFQAEDGIRDYKVTGVQTCALPIYVRSALHERTIALWLAASRGYLWYFRPSPRVSSSLPPPPPPDRGNNRRAFPFWRSRGPRKTQSLSHSTREPLRTRDLPPAPGILPTPT